MSGNDRLVRWVTAVVLGAICLVSSPSSPAQNSTETWETWVSQSYRLQPGESMPFRVDYAQIPVRSWRLVVESDHLLCDLHVLRLRDGSLLYFEADESRHRVEVPWGQGEEISAILTCGSHGGLFTISYLGPPRAEAPASYSYEVNRALEDYTAGKTQAAEEWLRKALRTDPADGVAMVLLAGFMRDRHYYSQANDLVQQALAQDLPPDMVDLASQMATELRVLQAPLSPEFRAGLLVAEQQLAGRDAAAALATCDSLLGQKASRSGEVQGQAQLLRGRALQALGRNFEAIDAYTLALATTRSREDQALIYFHMGLLYVDMENPTQAEGAFNVARQYGLPSGLDVQAAEAVRRIQANR